MDTVRRHHANVTIVNAEWVRAHGRKDLLDATADHTTAHRADLIRFWLLSEFGGLWLDTDVIAARPVTIHDALSGDVHLACLSHPGRRPESNLKGFCQSSMIAGVARAEATREAFARCKRFLATHRRGTFSWADSSDVVLESMHLWWTGVGSLTIIPPEQCYPWLTCGKIGEWHSDAHYAASLVGQDRFEAMHLCRSPVMAASKLGREGALADRSVVGFLFRRAFGLPPDNSAVPPQPHGGNGRHVLPDPTRRERSQAARAELLLERTFR